MTFYNMDELNIVDYKKICIFGAGMAGSAIMHYLQKHIRDVFIIADNDTSKHNKNEKYIICSVLDTIKMGCDKYFVGFMDNNESKLKSVVNNLTEQGINQDDIVLINMYGDWYKKMCEEYMIQQMQECNFFKSQNVAPRKIMFVTTGFTEKHLHNPGGGPPGAMCMQKKYLGSQIDDIKIEFLLYPPRNFEELFCCFEYVTYNIEVLKKVVKENSDAVYVVNDIFAAYVLKLLAARYLLVYHGQGEILNEFDAFEKNMSKYERELIYEIEKNAMEGAYNVCFPSKGAKKYFLETSNNEICLKESKPLYNTIYDYPDILLSEINREENCLTFLSVGQMTYLKGMDRIPDFLCRVAQIIDKNIRWIVVASGMLEKTVQEKMDEVNSLLDIDRKIEFININKKIPHSEIYHLMSISDIYIMLHRISIFDFATLEAMYNGKAIMLSDIPGNDEYNVNDNIFLINGDENDEEILAFVEDIELYGKKNRKAYQNNFTEIPFKKRYEEILKQFIADYKSEV